MAKVAKVIYKFPINAIFLVDNNYNKIINNHSPFCSRNLTQLGIVSSSFAVPSDFMEAASMVQEAYFSTIWGEVAAPLATTSRIARFIAVLTEEN